MPGAVVTGDGRSVLVMRADSGIAVLDVAGGSTLRLYVFDLVPAPDGSCRLDPAHEIDTALPRHVVTAIDEHTDSAFLVRAQDEGENGARVVWRHHESPAFPESFAESGVFRGASAYVSRIVVMSPPNICSPARIDGMTYRRAAGTLLLAALGSMPWAHGESARGTAVGPYVDTVWSRGTSLPSSVNRQQRKLIDRLLRSAVSAEELTTVTVDYPQNETIFPPEITAPLFLWHDAAPENDRWLVEVRFGRETSHLTVLVPGLSPPDGEIDPRCISDTNAIYEPTPYQASARAWRPSASVWATIKKHSTSQPATVTFFGYAGDAPDRVRSVGRITISTSTDPVAAMIFYRDVPLMPTATEKGVIQPLAPDATSLIAWRLKDISRDDSRVLLKDMPTCANCHSFSADGKTFGMDIDGPQGDKGAYAIVPLEKQTVIREDQVITWNDFPGKRKFLNTLGFMSQVSPEGRYSIATVNEETFVANFEDHEFVQVFYPTRGILAYYDRETDEIKALPGADDPEYVHCNPVWSPDGKTVVFARARARDAYIQGRPLPNYAGDPNETPIQYDLYRIPFNGGRGGRPEPILGASNNGMSNTFPKVSPDGDWVVFTQCKNGLLMRPDGRLWIVPLDGGKAREMRANLPVMNSWHSFSPNGHWLVFSSKGNTPYTQMFLTHIDADGNDSPAVLIENSTAANRAVNIPEFVNVGYEDLQSISVPAVAHHRDYERGNELARQGRFEEAVVEFQKALIGEENAWRVNDWRIHENLSSALLELGRHELALEHIYKSLRLNMANVRMHTNLGSLLSDKGLYDQALRHADLAIELDPRKALSWFNRGTLRLKAGDPVAAVEDYTMALRLDPNYAEAYSSRGIASREMGNLAGVLNDFDNAIRLDPALPAPWYFRGLMRWKSGDLAGARVDLTRALEIVPRNSPHRGEILKILRQIGASLEQKN